MGFIEKYQSKGGNLSAFMRMPIDQNNYICYLSEYLNKRNELKQNDLTYWALFKNGNQDALGRIFQTYFNEMFFYGVKIIPLPDLVKDVIQEIFVRLWERRENIGEVTKVKTYLLVALRNELLHAAKANSFREIESVVKSEPFTLGVEDFIIKEEETKKLNQSLVESLNRLSERQREVIVLRFYHNLKFEELADVLEMNVQSVRNLLFRALEKIRVDLKKYGFHAGDNIEIILFRLFHNTHTLAKSNFIEL